MNGGRAHGGWGRVASIVPDWSVYSGRRDPLRIPGLQQVLLLAGVGEVDLPGYPGLNWTCCGIYTVKVNGGGLESEAPVEPDTRYYNDPLPGFDPWRGLEKLASQLSSEAVEAYVNPLSWNPYTPIKLGRIEEGPPGCIYDQDEDVALADSAPPSLRASSATSCRRVRHGSAVEPRLGAFKVNTKGYEAGRGVYYVEAGECSGYILGGSLLAEGGCSLTIESPYYDYNVSIMYPGARYTVRVAGGGAVIGPVPAAAIGLWESIAVASRNGVTIEVKPGRLTVSSQGTLRATVGGYKAAYRVFVEDLLEWRVIRSPRTGYGNARGTASLILAGYEGDRLLFSIYNPDYEQGTVDVRLPYPGGECRVEGPLGETTIPVDGDLVRIPVPAGFLGTVAVTLETGVFQRFMARRRVRGP